MPHTKPIRCLTFALIAISSQIPTLATAQVRVVGDVPLQASQPRLNDNGGVIGGTIEGQPFIFEKNSHVALPAGPTPRDVNSSNEVVATQVVLSGPGSNQRPRTIVYRIDALGAVETINSSGGSSARINEAAEVGLGIVVPIDPLNAICMANSLSIFCPVTSVPALTSAEGAITTFRDALPDGLLGRVEGLNGSGDLVGTRTFVDTVTTQAFRKRHNASVELLPTLGGSSAEALAINDSGVAVGQAQDSTGENHAFRFDGNISDLGTLGGVSSKALAINNAGQIVGVAKNSAGLDRAFIYRNGVMTDLNSFRRAASNLTLLSATDINEFQEISGVAERSDSTGYVAYRFSFVDTSFIPGSDCRRIAGSRQILRRNQRCNFSGALADYRGRRLGNRTLIVQYALQKSGPWTGLALARTNRQGKFRKPISLVNAGYYRIVGPINDAELPFVPSGQIEVR